MDGLSAAASIVAVLQLASNVITYLSDVKDAPKECRKCMIEVSHSNTLLLRLDLRLSESSSGELWYQEVEALAVKDGPLDQYKQALQHLLKKVNHSNTTRRVANILIWTFVKDDVARVQARMERLMSIVSIALEMDHFKLSQAIKNDVSSMRSALPVLGASTLAIQTSVDTLRTETQAVKDDTGSIRNALPPLQATTSAIRDAQSLQQHAAIVEWLSPTDFPSLQHDIISRRQAGTGQWFLETNEFNRWVNGSDKTLFCPGIPGAGKTMMAAIAIDHLHRTICGRDIEVAHLFCSYKGTADLTASDFFAAILKQLVQSRPDISTLLTGLYNNCSGRRSRPSLEEILSAIQLACRNYVNIFIVVDALDECNDPNGTREKLIHELRQLQTASIIDLRLMFTSRFIPGITQKFNSDVVLEVKASEEDIGRFVAGQIPRLPKCIQRDEALKNMVQSKVIEAVDGMFLLARLRIESLFGHTTKKKVLSKLDTFRTGAEALDQAYSDALDRIEGQLDGYRDLAKRTLSWITYAQRLLTTKELCHALAIEPGASYLDPDNIDEIEDIISVCAGLVTVDKESNIVRLVHYTTQEYFERVRVEWIPGAQNDIAKACLTYLSFDTFRSGSCGDDNALEQRLIENPLFDYISCFWSEHIRAVECATSRLALEFLHNNALVDCAVQQALAPMYHYSGYSQRFPHKTSGLHMTAMHGLVHLTEELLKDNNIGVDSKDGSGKTPLSWAAWRGNEAVVRLLLDRDDVVADSKDMLNMTPLSRAAMRGHEAVVRALLETNQVDLDSEDKFFKTPLSYAVEQKHEAVVRLLQQFKKS